MRKICGLSCLLLTCVMLFSGCGNKNDEALSLQDYNDTNIKKLCNTYKMFMEMHNYEGPKNAEELKDYLTNNAGAKVRRERMGITDEDLDSMFTSERDEQPFEVRWGLKGQFDHAIVFEKTGVEGKRLVALAQPRELGKDEYDGYFSGETKPEGPAGTEEMGPSDEEMSGPTGEEG